MQFRYFFGIFFFVMNLCTTLFCHDFQRKIISDSIDYLQLIVTEAPEIIKQSEDDKFYLKEDRIYLSGEGLCVLRADKEDIPLHQALIFSDKEGSYLSLSGEELAEKLFKNVCYNCKYEWQGGAFTWRCPNCGSTNIGNVPNW